MSKSTPESESPDPSELADLHTDIETRHVEDVIAYGNNPKEHPPEQVSKIASSIKNYGWDQPIVVDGQNEIIKGHGRKQAARKLGLDVVPVIVRTDLTDAEKKAARIADNKTAESPWDDDLLATEIEILDETTDVDLEESLGFDPGEIDDLLDDVEVPDFDPVPEDEQPRLDESEGVDPGEKSVRCPDCGNTFTTET